MNIILIQGNINIAVAVLVFVIGFFCLVRTKNMVRMIISIEIMARGASLALISFGYINGSGSIAQSLVVTVIVIEVVVTAIALALIMNLYKKTGSLDASGLNKLKG